MADQRTIRPSQQEQPAVADLTRGPDQPTLDPRVTTESTSLTDPGMVAAPRLPFYVWIDDPDLRQPTLAAMSLWNEAVGAEILVQAPDSQAADIRVSTGEVEKLEGGGEAAARGGGGMVEVAPQTATGDPNYLLTVMSHELGHNLGLEHPFHGQAASESGGEYTPGAYIPNENIVGIMGDGNVILGFEAARARRLLGLSPDRESEAQITTGIPNEATGKAIARSAPNTAGWIEGPAPFAGFGQRLSKQITGHGPLDQRRAAATAASMVLAGLWNRWATFPPGAGAGTVRWAPESAHYTYQDFTEDVDHVVREVFHAKGEQAPGPISKGAAPAETPAAVRARQIA